MKYYRYAIYVFENEKPMFIEMYANSAKEAEYKIRCLIDDTYLDDGLVLCFSWYAYENTNPGE